MRAALVAWIWLCLGLASCGAGSRPGPADGDGDVDGDSDSDGDGDDPRPDCPTGDDLVLGDPCDGQEDCDPPICGRQGGVCIEETWTCGRCDYCFFTRTPHLEDPSLACDPDEGRCVPP